MLVYIYVKFAVQLQKLHVYKIKYHHDSETLRAGYLSGHMVETFIVNEIMKSYDNNAEAAGFY